MRVPSLLLFLAWVVSHADSLSLRAVQKQRVVGFLAHAGAAVFAGSEVLEDVREIGHGHGLLLLGCSKICREVNLLRESVQEESEELKEQASRKKWVARALDPFVSGWRMFFSRKTSALLATAALGAAFVEVVQDSLPGGHHGTVCLALSELLELLTESGLVKGRMWSELIANQVLRLGLAVGAIILALMETARSTQQAMGAHHAVLVIALSKTLRCIGFLLDDEPENEKKVA